MHWNTARCVGDKGEAICNGGDDSCLIFGAETAASEKVL